MYVVATIAAATTLGNAAGPNTAPAAPAIKAASAADGAHFDADNAAAARMDAHTCSLEGRSRGTQ